MVHGGLAGQVLTPAKSNLQPHLRGVWHQSLWIDRAELGVGYGDARQEGVQQRALGRLDGAGLDSAIAAQRTMGAFGGRGLVRWISHPRRI